MKKIIISISIAAVLAVLFIAGYLFLLLLIIPIRRTLYGSLNILMTSLKEQHPNSEIYFLTSIFRNMHYNEAIPFTGTVNSNVIGQFMIAFRVKKIIDE